MTKRRDGLVGVLFTPRVRTRRPAVLVFGGSEGGNGMIDAAAVLAAHGYPTLALAYFGDPGLPSQLVNVPLEYFARAVRVLRRVPEVDPARIAVMGASRGGELALLLAATFPHLIHGAIGLVPSDDRLPGARGRAQGLDAARQAPAARGDPRRADHRPGADRRARATTASGPRGESVEQIERRLTAHRFRFPHQGLVYEHAGHLIGSALPYLPANGATRRLRRDPARGRRRPGRPLAAHPALPRRARGVLTRRTRRPQPIRTNRAPGGVGRRRRRT